MLWIDDAGNTLWQPMGGRWLGRTRRLAAGTAPRADFLDSLGCWALLGMASDVFAPLGNRFALWLGMTKAVPPGSGVPLFLQLLPGAAVILGIALCARRMGEATDGPIDPPTPARMGALGPVYHSRLLAAGLCWWLGDTVWDTAAQVACQHFAGP